MIAQTVTALVALRKEVISDIYQIMGLSDIMRGATDPDETLGAQQLKTQYGSTRIRDKQYEMVRVARDLVCIIVEIIAEKFKPETIIRMSQTQLPTKEMQQQQARMVMEQLQNQKKAIEMMQQLPQVQQMAQSNPEQAQQVQQQAQQLMQTGQETIKRIMEQPNIDQVLRFLKDNRARSFVLDIETDSTIMQDENAEKQRRAEFVGMLSALLPQIATMVAAEPQTADFCGELIKFSTAPFRAGRALEGAVDELIQQMKQKADQPQADDPTTAAGKITLQVEQIKQQRQAERDKADVALKQAELQQRDQHEKMKLQSNHALKVMELRQKQGDQQGKMQEANFKAMQSREERRRT